VKQHRTNVVKDENVMTLETSWVFWQNWKNHFSQLFNAHGVSEVGQSEIHTAKPLVTQSRAFDFEMFIENVKRHKFPGDDRIPAQFIKSGDTKTCSEILKTS
jgi:hypothetical protein